MKEDKNRRWANKGWGNREPKAKSGWARRRKSVMDRDNWLCQPCRKKGRLTEATECDHIKPVAEGGSEEEDNLQAICKDCHALKTADEASRSRGFKIKKEIGLDGWPIK